ncbi:MAG: hypothetical protein QOD61_2559 [Solirubrobacteraceae bacterium]|nr:hypothetical protein [Solirubrobacteraceae bacterium]
MVVALGLLLGGCGSSGSRHRHAATTTPRPAAATPKAGNTGPGTITIPAPSPTGRPADPAAVKVIEGWSSALRSGDVSAAARFFALPSTMINGIDGAGQPLVLSIDTSVQALAANATLPCGARFISADQRGRYVNALFRLTGRPGPGGSDCGGGPGLTARTNFVIAHGRIVKWIRAPDDPGDNGGQTTPPAPTPQPPQNAPGGVPVV